MKIKFFLHLLVVLCPIFASAQNPEDWQMLEFDTPEDYKNNEDKVLECAHFVLEMPAEAGNPARQNAMAVLAKWMAGTTDYKFFIGESVGKLMNKNEAIMSLYMAAMTRYVLENKDKAKNETEVTLHSFEYLLDYCADSHNKVPMTKELKKAINAKENGRLKDYLSL
jgi:hypothetical protein